MIIIKTLKKKVKVNYGNEKEGIVNVRKDVERREKKKKGEKREMEMNEWMKRMEEQIVRKEEREKKREEREKR